MNPSLCTGTLDVEHVKIFITLYCVDVYTLQDVL